MPKFLQVPLLQQPRGSFWCGPACAGMVNAYLTGKEIPLRKIAHAFAVREHMFKSNGSYDFLIGSWLMTQGVTPEVRGDAVTAGPITRRLRLSKKKYLAAGGVFVPRHLRRPRIMRELLEKRPVIAYVDVNHLHGIRGEKPSGHFVVLVGATRGKVWYLDPMHPTLQVRSWKRFLHAAKVSGYSMMLFPGAVPARV